MQRILHLIMVSAVLTLLSCGGGKNKLEDKRKELEKLKKEQTALNDKIEKLTGEITELDPASMAEKPKLVSITPIGKQNFTHYLDLQGKIDAENIAYVTPRNGVGGQVKAIYVKKGDYVKQGQLLLKLDDVLIRKQIAQAETQLAYAQDIYNRRNNLWKENIGTEVELISAKNNVDNAQRQIDILKEQLGLMNVYAGMTGIAEDVTIRVGEIFTGSPQAGFIKLVNTSQLKVITQVPENYMDKIKTGSPIEVYLPDIGKTINARVTLSGKLIDPNSHSFYVEAHLPADKDLKPNQIALVKILDYTVPEAITIPVNTLQNDDKGKFVLLAVKQKDNKMYAAKRPIEIGELYGDKLEVKNGLQVGELLITEGSQNLYDGQLITTEVQ